MEVRIGVFLTKWLQKSFFVVAGTHGLLVVEITCGEKATFLNFKTILGDFHMTLLLNIQTTKLYILLRFYFHDV